MMKIELEKLLLLVLCPIWLTTCTKAFQMDGLLGTTWVPIHATGGYYFDDYTIAWDDDIDENGVLTVFYERNGKSIEYSMAFRGYKFFKNGKEGVYSTFSPSDPNGLSTPYRYYVRDNRIYFERVISSGESFSSSRKEEDDAKTQFDSSVLTEFTTDRMTFDGVTYRRVD